MTLYPIPKERGIYYVDMKKKKLVKLDINGKVKWTERRRRTLMAEYDVKFYIDTFQKIPIFATPKAKFIDYEPKILAPIKIRKDGLIFEKINAGLFGGKKYSGFIKEKLKKFNKERLSIRELNLTPGQYAWVETTKDYEYDFYKPASKGIAFVFKIEGTQSSKNDK